MSKLDYIGLVGMVVVIILTVFLNYRWKQTPDKARIYFREDIKPKYSDVIELYRKLGYNHIANEIEKLSLPCVEFIPDVSGSIGNLFCSSKIGGLPGLPDKDLWPIWQGKSLSFIAQVNLEQLPESALTEWFPSKGILYFFYDFEQSTWGFDPKDKGSWQVIYLDKVPAKLEDISYPTDVPEHARFNEVVLVPNAETSIPDLFSVISNDSSLTNKQKREVFQIEGEFLGHRGSLHQLLGQPAIIQNEMELECQLVSHGLYCGEPSVYNDPKAKELKHGATEWKLLFQIDSDDNAGMMWGDAGRLYFWIRKEDLKDKRFDRTWMILQCG